MEVNEGYYARWEKTFKKVLTPFEEFIHSETNSGLLLIGCTIVALLIANSNLASAYAHILHTHLTITAGSLILDYTLHHWINDGLMALFFFVVGLEIKREILVGELSDRRQAALPIFAAVGGMVVPALLYAVINLGGPGTQGWGIPMATDIAFAVGVLVLLGNRIPKTLLTFLVALAIVDDLGAVLVIAVFYTDQLALEALAVAAVLIGVLIALNQGGIRKPWPYFVVGVLLWIAMLKSGVHATLAGILTALTIPARPKFDPQRFSIHVRELMDRFDENCTAAASLMQNQNQRAIVQTLENGIHQVESPLQRLEHVSHIPVAFLILPVFALANAGVPINFDNLGETLSQPITLGVMIGLVLGKLVGVAGFSIFALKQGWGQLPAGTNFRHIIGVGFLSGIGFTMSIFIAELAFSGNGQELIMAKTGVLFASLIAGVIGCLWLLLTTQKKQV